VLGFLAAGVMLGPFGLGRLAGDIPLAGFLTISDPEEISVIAELGVVLLLFMIGLEMSLERLKRLRRFIIGLGGAQVLVTGGVIAAGRRLLRSGVGARDRAGARHGAVLHRHRPARAGGA
jgi:CPA2 family monovalent cation:H+ antiporter-2